MNESKRAYDAQVSILFRTSATDHIRFNTTRDPFSVLDVGVDRAAQSEGSVIGDGNRLLLILCGEKERDRSKELPVESGVVGFNVGEDRRLHECTLMADAIASSE